MAQQALYKKESCGQRGTLYYYKVLLHSGVEHFYNNASEGTKSQNIPGFLKNNVENLLEEEQLLWERALTGKGQWVLQVLKQYTYLQLVVDEQTWCEMDRDLRVKQIEVLKDQPLTPCRNPSLLKATPSMVDAR